MILSCNSCDKKFVVPDNAITAAGRLVQCSSCGNKWTQFPIKKIIPKQKDADIKIFNNENQSNTNLKVAVKKTIQKKVPKKKVSKKKKNLYTEEYLLKKHGLSINNIENDIKKEKKAKIKKTSFGFYNYLIIFLVFISLIIGVFHLSKEMIIQNYPFVEIYVEYFYETINIIKTLILELLIQYKN